MATTRRVDAATVDPNLIVQVLQDIERLIPGGAPPSAAGDVTALLIAAVSLAVGLSVFGGSTAQTLVAVIPTAVAVVWRVVAHVVAAVRAGHKATVAAATIRAHTGAGS